MNSRDPLHNLGALGALALGLMAAACEPGRPPALDEASAALLGPATDTLRLYAIAGTWRWDFVPDPGATAGNSQSGTGSVDGGPPPPPPGEGGGSGTILPPESVSFNIPAPPGSIAAPTTVRVWQVVQPTRDAPTELRAPDGSVQCRFDGAALTDARGAVLLRVEAGEVIDPQTRSAPLGFEGDRLVAAGGCAQVWSSQPLDALSLTRKVASVALVRGLCGAPLPPPSELTCARATTACTLGASGGSVEPCPTNGAVPGGLTIAPPPPTVTPGDRVMFRYATGELAGDYGAQRSRSLELGFVPSAASAFRLPGGSTVYSGIFVRDLDVNASTVRQDVAGDDLAAEIAARAAQGYRLVDLDGEEVAGASVFQAAFVREVQQPMWGYLRGAAAPVATRVAQLKQFGFRPIRAHGYRVGQGVEHVVVLARDSIGADVRVFFGLNGPDYQAQLAQAQVDGYAPTDLDVYLAPGDELRLDVIFTRDATVVSSAVVGDLDRAGFEAEHEARVLAGFKLVDVEVYGRSSRRSQARYAGVWHRPERDRLRANLSLTTNLSPTRAAALATLQAAIDAHQDAGFEMGFVVEDLKTGFRMTYNPDSPMYMASTSKVIIAGAVMMQLDEGTLTRNQLVALAADDLLEVGDQPDVAGNYSVDQLLRWMLNNSSTDATDALVRLVGQDYLDDFVARRLQVENVHEVTSICEVDRRIMMGDAPCAAAVSCKTLIDVARNGQAAPDTCSALSADAAITNEAYRAYYTSLANTATPRAFGRVWRRLLEPGLISGTQRAYLLSILDATNDTLDNVVCGAPGAGACTAAMATSYNDFAMKNGGKRWITSWVAVGHRQTGAGASLVRDPQYAISIFTSREPMSVRASAASNTAIQTIAASAVAFLQDARP